MNNGSEDGNRVAVSNGIDSPHTLCCVHPDPEIILSSGEDILQRPSKRSLVWILVCALFLTTASSAWGGDGIPKAAWTRPLGLPLENPGVTRVAGDIDDGYWQGVPVGGFGAGTFSRSYRGDFARWHIKAGVHKYEPVYANQIAMFQQSEGDPRGTAQVLMNGHPNNGELSSWQWDYPIGAGD